MPAKIERREPEIFRFADIDSTNAEALRRARLGQDKPAWFVAQTQSRGRGRYGRGWSSAPGGLYASYLLVSDLPVQALVGLTFVAGIAVHQTVATHLAKTATPDLLLKWPNDILAGGAKIAGILIQTEPLDKGATAIAIGVGLNVVNTPEGGEIQATSLSQLGGNANVELVFSTLADVMAGQLSLWDQGRGMPAILAAWQARAMAPGTATRVRLPQGTITGTYAGLDPSGGLRLRLESGKTQTIHAGDITISPPLQTRSGAHP